MLALPLTPRRRRGRLRRAAAAARRRVRGDQHAVAASTRSVPVPGLIAVAGGKYTTYRVMASDAVDAVRAGSTAPCRRRHRRIAAARRRGLPRPGTRAARLADASGLHVARIEHLLRRYGSPRRALDADRATTRRWPSRWRAPTTTCAVEVRLRRRRRGRAHLDDVLTRRTRISIETWDRGLAAAEPAARLMAGRWAGTRTRRPRGRALPRARRGRARVAGAGRRPGRGRRAHRRAGVRRASARARARPAAGAWWLVSVQPALELVQRPAVALLQHERRSVRRETAASVSTASLRGRRAPPLRARRRRVDDRGRAGDVAPLALRQHGGERRLGRGAGDRAPWCVPAVLEDRARDAGRDRHDHLRVLGLQVGARRRPDAGLGVDQVVELGDELPASSRRCRRRSGRTRRPHLAMSRTLVRA